MRTFALSRNKEKSLLLEERQDFLENVLNTSAMNVILFSMDCDRLALGSIHTFVMLLLP